MVYCYFSSIKTKPGYRDKVLTHLLSGADSLRAAGCSLYAVSVSDTDEDTIFVSEIWQSKERRDESLQLSEVRNAISAAMPMLTGEYARLEITVVGGFRV